MSQQTQAQLPQEAIKLLEQIREKHQIGLEELQNEVLKKYNTSRFFQTDTTKSLEEKLIFCAKTVKGEYFNLIPYNPYNVVPTGIGPLRVTKAGTKRGEIHVWTKEKNTLDVLRSVSIIDSDLDKLLQIQLFNYYKDVKLGKFSSGDFSADHRTVFQNPTLVNMQPLQIFEKLNIKRCKISEVFSNLAKEQNKFTVSTDCRIIRGIIIKHAKGVKETDSGVKREWAYYDIFDNSLDEDITDPDGTVVSPIFRVWVHPMWMIYDDDNQIDFIGPIASYNKGVSMSGYTLIPAYTPSGTIKDQPKEET